VSRIRRAAGLHCAEPVVLLRHEVLGGAPGDREGYRSPAGCLIEIAPEFVICRVPGLPIAVTPRLGAVADIADTVMHGVIGAGPVMIDVPLGVAGAAALAAALAGHVHGHDVQIVDDTVLAVTCAPEQQAPVPPRRRPTVRPVAAGLLLALGVLLGLSRTGEPAQHPTTEFTEGRVTVHIPVGWEVHRITDGAGSPRVQVFSSTEESAAILLTQSVAGPDPGRTADVLRTALALQPPGIFTGLRTDDHRGGRAVLSYVEMRADREIAWAVFVDNSVRIAVGCQQPRSGAVIRPHCDEAIRSARAAP
jgi:type VII secretion-associated protein (TIGR03931 family)